MDRKTVLRFEENGDNPTVYAAILLHHGFRVLEASAVAAV